MEPIKARWKVWFALVFSLWAGLVQLSAQEVRTVYQQAMGEAACQERVYLLERCHFVLRQVPEEYPVDFRREVRKNLGLAYAECQQWAEADHFLQLEELAENNDTLRQELRFERVSLAMQSRNWERAAQLLELFYPEGTDEQARRTDFLQGVVAFHREDDEASEGWFLRCARNEFHRAQIEREFEELSRKGKGSPRLVMALSHVLPGLGQLTQGDYRNALNSLLLTGAILGGGVYVGLALTWVEAVVLAGPSFWRYYRGGAKRAGESVRKRYRARRMQTLERLIESYR